MMRHFPRLILIVLAGTVTLHAQQIHAKFFSALAILYAQAGQLEKSAACAKIVTRLAAAESSDKAPRPTLQTSDGN